MDVWPACLTVRQRKNREEGGVAKEKAVVWTGEAMKRRRDCWWLWQDENGQLFIEEEQRQNVLFL